MTSHHRTILCAASAVAFLLSAPITAHAQGGAEHALSQLDVGDHVRVRGRAGGVVQGTLVSVRGDSVRVRTDTRLHALALGDVSGVWVRSRSTTRGLAIGAGLGALVGVGLGAFFAAYGEGGSEDAGGALILSLGTVGTAVGGAGGAIIGTAVPRWKRLYADGRARPMPDEDEPSIPRVEERDEPPVAADPASADSAWSPATERRRLGAVTLSGGFATLAGEGGSTGGAEARLSVLGEWYLGGRPGGRRTFFSIGPEVGRASLGTTPPRAHVHPVNSCLPDCTRTLDTLTYAREYDADVARGIVRLGMEDGALRGYAVAGAGWQWWRTRAREDDIAPNSNFSLANEYSAVSATYGAGVQYRLGLRDAVGIEARHNAIRLHGMDFADGYWGIAATYTRTW